MTWVFSPSPWIHFQSRRCPRSHSCSSSPRSKLPTSSSPSPIQTPTHHFPILFRSLSPAPAAREPMEEGSPETVSGEQLQSEPKEGPKFAEQRIVIINNHGEKLVGVLQKADSEDIVILCHGFRSSRESKTIKRLADTLLVEGLSIFRFDFSGNGESEGTFQYGNYWKEVDDLRAVVLYLSERKHRIRAVAGHSKGGNVVLLYASMYHDIPTVVNISGRFDITKGIEERLGNDFLQRIKADGFIDVKGTTGLVAYRVTEESLMERLATDMHAACLKIDRNCRILTVHGSSDEIVPVEDALEFDTLIPNHKLHVIEGADHVYTFHHGELASTMLDFLK